MSGNVCGHCSFYLILTNAFLRYVILALAFYVYPDQATDDALFHI